MSDGVMLAEFNLPSLPTWDGLSAAGGRLYRSAANGSVTGLSER